MFVCNQDNQKSYELIFFYRKLVTMITTRVYPLSLDFRDSVECIPSIGPGLE